MDSISLSIIKERLSKWWFNYRLLLLHLQNCYLTEDKCNTDLDIRENMWNNYLLNNCDKLVRYVIQMATFDL